MRANMRPHHNVRQGQILVAMWCAATLALLAGCDQSNGFSPTQTRIADPIPSLSACVQRWNNASLGDGSLSASREAMTGKAALVFTFQNGACGLVFPTHTANKAEKQYATYVSIDGGNFSLDWSPLGLVRRSEIEKLRADASRHTNVTVERKTGRIVALHQHGQTLNVPANVFISPPGGCKRVTLPNSLYVGRYNVVHTDVSCIMTRTLLWAWATERSPAHPEAIHILGWACVGTEGHPISTLVRRSSKRSLVQLAQM
jgi:hypothetical protein